MGNRRCVMTSSVLFYADARPQAGGGHMSRCINLARALRPSCEVTFAITADAAPHWVDRLRGQGITIVNGKFVNKGAVTVLDSYELDAPAVAKWRRGSRALVMIEDLGQHFGDVDLYVSFAGPAPAGVRVLAGPQYALLGPAYARAVVPRGAGSILVTCGMRDSANATGLYLNALARCAVGGKVVTVVLGEAAPHRAAVEHQARELGAKVLFDASDMAPLYEDADLVLGTGGVSLFECLARGRASVTVIAADNQVYSAKQMASLGATSLAGDLKMINASSVAKLVNALLANGDARSKMGALARQAVDGRGAERVAREIVALAGAVPQRAPAAAGH
jgi:spore coat polysaccharide biosynthesis predicted glycosyltransferase SpsG